MPRDEAIKLDPNYARAWNGKGIALADQGKFDEALKALGMDDKLMLLSPSQGARRASFCPSPSHPVYRMQAATGPRPPALRQTKASSPNTSNPAREGLGKELAAVLEKAEKRNLYVVPGLCRI